MSEKVLVIGNGTAAIQGIKAMRRNGLQGEITLLSDKMLPCYNPMLTTYYIAGKIPLKNCFPYGANRSIYRDFEVHTKLGSAVVELDTDNQIVKTADNKTHFYDKCLIASGSSPLVPPIPGLDSDHVFTVRTMEAAVALKKAFKNKPTRVLVVGASMIGIKIVEICMAMGIETYLADMGTNIFPLAAHPNCSNLIEAKLEKSGVYLLLDSALKGVESYSSGLRAYFTEQEPVDADLLVLCLGIKANTAFINHSQISVDRAILIDDNMKTNVENVYAAGDVSQGTNMLTGNKEMIGLWANANYQGRTAGRNMAGIPDKYPGTVPCNITKFMGMAFAGIGEAHSQGQEIERSCSEKMTYSRLVWDNNALVGANMLNDFSFSGVIKQQIIKDIISKEMKGKMTGGTLPSLVDILMDRAVRNIEQSKSGEELDHVRSARSF